MFLNKRPWSLEMLVGRTCDDTDISMCAAWKWCAHTKWLLWVGSGNQSLLKIFSRIWNEKISWVDVGLVDCMRNRENRALHRLGLQRLDVTTTPHDASIVFHTHILTNMGVQPMGWEEEGDQTLHVHWHIALQCDLARCIRAKWLEQTPIATDTHNGLWTLAFLWFSKTQISSCQLFVHRALNNSRADVYPSVNTIEVVSGVSVAYPF